MLTIIICVIILIILVADSSIVISGASYGLLLWYKNVLPILLPFMLISGIMVCRVNELSEKSNKSSKNPSALGVFATVFLGVLCGYPLGAKTSADFVKSGVYSKRTGNLLLPLCNNSSPMFISGYIVHFILKDKISLMLALAAIYLPYVLFLGISLILGRFKPTVCQTIPCSQKNNLPVPAAATLAADSNIDYMQTAVTQITFVGVYIMLCSIIIEFVSQIQCIPNKAAVYISGITEITRGLQQINLSGFLASDTKTALILALASFGGISSILQTNKVINKSGLSIIQYIFSKAICASATYFLVLLLI